MARLTLSQQLMAAQSQNAELVLQLRALEGRLLLAQQHAEGLVKEHENQRLLTAADYEKKVKEVGNLQGYYQKQAADATAEVEQINVVLDGIEGAPARTYEMEYGKGQRGIIARLAGALISVARQSRGV
jgi:SMC interacting uncharacterized protein involved in chromosome segregation